MDRPGSSFARALRRLWATLLLACALSLVNGAVAGAAEVGIDLQEISQAVAADDSAVCDETADGDAGDKAEADHCAVCCAHTTVALPAVGAAVITSATASVAPVAPLARARSNIPHLTDQPPRV